MALPELARASGRPSRRALALAAAGVAVALTGCSVGVEAGTLDKATSHGGELDAGDLRVRGGYVVVGERGDAVVTITLTNNGAADEALTAMTITDSTGPVEAILRPAEISVPAGTTAVVPGEPRSEISADVDAAAGTYVFASLVFENAGTLQVSMLVVAATGAFEQYATR